MPSSYTVRSLSSTIRKGIPGSTPKSQSKDYASLGIARVTRVVLSKDSCSDEEWELYQKSQALYGVFCKALKLGLNGKLVEESVEQFAYCGDAVIRRIPVVGEIVELVGKVSIDLVAQNKNAVRHKIYWSQVLAGWNHPHLNALPLGEFGDENFKDRGNEVNPLQLCPGDVTVEGRHGESLRFGGTNYTDSPIATEDTNGKPYVILRAGQGTDNEGYGDRAIYEDINKDGASIYLATGQVVPLEQAADKRAAWKGTVTEAKDYKDNQIILTSDRVWLNGRDDVELSAKNYVGTTANEVNVDGKNQVSLDAKKIYLGTKAQEEKEPVLKGKTTTQMISDLVDQFITLLDTINKAGESGQGDPAAFIGSLQSTAKMLKPILNMYKSQLPSLHSTKVFTE